MTNESAAVTSSSAATATAASEASSEPLGPPPRRNSRIFLAADTPVFLEPDRTRTPLRVLDRGTKLQFLDASGVWYHVTFEDPQWGTRYGYVEGRFVQPLPPAMALIQRLLEQQRGQRPVDLSVPGPDQSPPIERGTASNR